MARRAGILSKMNFSLVRSPARRLTPPLRRISVSDLMQTYSTVLDLHHIKTPEEGLFYWEEIEQLPKWERTPAEAKRPLTLHDF